MPAPANIRTCINDIIRHSSGKFPVHFASMGGKNGSGCDVVSVNSTRGEIEILYRGKTFTIDQEIYSEFEDRFNFLDKRGMTLRDGRPEKYGVNRYQEKHWKNTPLGLHRNPLPATIFKGLGY